jgi:LPS-assembly lipoprotein
MSLCSPRHPLLRYCLIAALALALSACGFALRGPVTLPFSSIYLNLPVNAPLRIELQRNLLADGQTRLARTEQDADVVFEVLSESKDKSILALNSQGRVREYSLAYTLRFRVRNSVGKIFLDTTELNLKRNLTFNESEILAKESEEALLYRDMQADLVQQIMRRLSALKME